MASDQKYGRALAISLPTIANSARVELGDGLRPVRVHQKWNLPAVST